MRVIAGKYRGRVLAGFRGDAIRPTSDRVKESLFAVLTPRLAGARVLDLFCGSGALGIEALSRGAREAVFNDIARESVALCKKNLNAIGIAAEISVRDYRACLLGAAGKFGIIFSDPPYRERYTEEILRLVRERDLLEEGGCVVAESEREEVAPEGWVRADLRSYGRTKIAIFERSDP